MTRSPPMAAALLLAGLAVLGAAPGARAQDPGKVLHHQKISSTEGGFVGPLHDADLFGTSVARIGDLDADGVIDIVAGAYLDDDGGIDTGAAWILFLRPDGTVQAQSKISALSGGFTGTLHAEDLFGWSAGALGDLDGDGVPDIAVGGWLDDEGAGPGTDFGAVWVLFLNADGTVKSLQKIGAVQGGFTGLLEDGDRFGTSLSALGDLDGDGVTELAAGAIYDDDGGFNCGAAWILFLRADGTVKSQQKISDLEGGLSAVLDVNDRFGYASAALGDLDGDGVPDLAVGAILDGDAGPQRGAVWILFLNADGTVRASQKINDASGGFTGVLHDSDVFGRSIANLGDLDGDGVIDIAVGAAGDDDGGSDALGAVWILFLRPDGTVKAHQKISATQGAFTGSLEDFDSFGQSTAALGDLDLDGVTDLAVGALGDGDGGDFRGAVWILFLSDGTWNNLGHALAGTAGPPALSGLGPLVAGTEIELRLVDSLPGAKGMLVVGTSLLQAPFKGGVLVPQIAPPSALLALTMPPTGQFDLKATWPPGIPPGTTLWFQVWLVDAGGPVGIAASNGLSATGH